jgi:RecB family exonuclease
MVNVVFSYTALEQFETCPRQFEAQRILKVIKNAETFERSSGEDGHAVVERAIKSGGHVPADRPECANMVQFAYQHFPWTQAYAEIPLALDHDWRPLPLSMNGDVPWGRTFVFAKLDFLGLNERDQTLSYLDWKFGKSTKPKMAQVEYGMLLAMLAMPAVQQAQGRLVFKDGVITPPVQLSRQQLPHTQAIWMARIQEVQDAIAHKNFPAKPSGLCRGWCNYTQCEHWKPKAQK